jgi:phage FluMu protein Com
MKNAPDTIPVNCNIPSELNDMMDDYRAIVNHLLAYGIHNKIGLEKHYYPLADGDTSGKQKPIPPFRELRDNNKNWFDTNYKGKYAAHYLGSASSFAMQLISSWRTNGGDITATPYLKKPIARLAGTLFTIQKSESDGTIQIRITIAPRKSVIINTKVNHRHWTEWSKNRLGELVIVPSGLRLCFTDDIKILKSKESVAYDFNFDRVVMARSDGEIKEVDLSDVLKIQKNHKRKRESVQKTMRHNPVKGQRINRKNAGREHNRVDDLLHKKIHGKNNEILSFIGNRHLGIEDLSKTTRDVLKTDNGKKFNAKMSLWIHGSFEQIIAHHHPDNKLYYTRGTSRWCPFCNSILTHPVWKESKCPNCNANNTIFDRDRLEAASGLVRTNTKHKKGESWALVHDVFNKNIEYKLLQSSMMIRGLSSGQSGQKSVHPECVVLSPVEQSDIDISNNVMLENRSDVCTGNSCTGLSEMIIESGYDANSKIVKYPYKGDVCL